MSQDQQNNARPPISENATLYEVLGVLPHASPDDIHVAYRRLALLYHPDRHPEADREWAGEVFKRIASAYRILSNENERRRYDVSAEQGGVFHESVNDENQITLADILAGIDMYEHIFSSEPLRQMNPKLREIVMPRLLTDVNEQIVGVWKMAEPPAGSIHQGSYTGGAVVLTNLRVLLPFTYSWTETQGNTKYHYTGAGMPSFVLPYIREITIVSQKRIKSKICVEIKSEEGTTKFRPEHCNLGKLMLIARFWGIKVQAHEQDSKREEWKWVLYKPLIWAVGSLLAVMVLAAAAGIFWGGVWDNPMDLADYMSRTGLWQWYAIAWTGACATRIWRFVKIYQASTLMSAAAESATPGTIREQHTAVHKAAF